MRFEVLDKAWSAYKAENPIKFAQRVRRLREWAEGQTTCGRTQHAVLILGEEGTVPQGLRPSPRPSTSNAVDRLINHLAAASLPMRSSMARSKAADLLSGDGSAGNFHPYGPFLRSLDSQRRSPFMT